MKIYLLEVYPETIALMNYVITELEKDGTEFEIVINERLKGPMMNWIIGWTLNHRQYKTAPTLEDMIGLILNDIKMHETPIPIAVKTNDRIPFRVLEAVRCGEAIETGFPVRKYQVIFKEEMMKEELKNFGALSNHKKYFTHSSRVSQGRTHIPKVVLFCSAGFAITGASLGDGSGMGNLLYILARNTALACRRYGYDLILTTEDQLEKLELSSQDKVIGLTVNGPYGGGRTTLGQGIRIGNLKMLAVKTKGLQTDPVIVCCVHATEVMHYGNLEGEELNQISRIDFRPFHSIGINSMKSKGLKSTASFPIPIDDKKIEVPERTASNKKTILLQLDIQTRKNGEYSLAMVLDAARIAVERDQHLSVDVICKSSAAHSYTGEHMLKLLLNGMNYVNHPRIRIVFQGAVNLQEWDKTRNSVDLLVAFSLEEGLHYFVPEMWLRGAYVALTEPGALSAFTDLPGVIKITGTMIPSFGSGIYNDYFEGSVPFPDYNDAVSKISWFLNQTHSIKSRKLSEPFDTDGESIAKALEMTPQYRKEIKVLRASHAYARISL